jgi:hypothetical protein
MNSQAWHTSQVSYSTESDGALHELVHMMQDPESASNRRKFERFKVSAPLTLVAGGREIPAYTRNLSDRGVYFYLNSDDSELIDRDIEFMLELPPEITLLPCCRVRCRGQVLRKETGLMSLTGVAAQILDYLVLKDAVSIT